MKPTANSREVELATPEDIPNVTELLAQVAPREYDLTVRRGRPWNMGLDWKRVQKFHGELVQYGRDLYAGLIEAVCEDHRDRGLWKDELGPRANAALAKMPSEYQHKRAPFLRAARRAVGAPERLEKLDPATS